jgi:hypothetical protein
MHVVLQLSTWVHWDACCPSIVNMSALRCMSSFMRQHECIEMHVCLSTWCIENPTWQSCIPSTTLDYTTLHLFSPTLWLSSLLSLECFPLSLLSAKCKSESGWVSALRCMYVCLHDALKIQRDKAAYLERAENNSEMRNVAGLARQRAKERRRTRYQWFTGSMSLRGSAVWKNAVI